jgi:ABC-type glutathione transport system ATPase component
VRDDFKITVLLVEHHMSLVMGVSDKVVALNFGRKIAVTILRRMCVSTPTSFRPIWVATIKSTAPGPRPD